MLKTAAATGLDRAAAFDLVIRRGRIIDPSQRFDAIGDVAISHGRIAAVGEDLDRAAARKRIDASGRIVVPGLVDLHTHLYAGVSKLGVEADTACLPTGVTTAIDAGSAGAITFPGFRDWAVRPARTRIRAFLNLSSVGLIIDDGLELAGMHYADVGAAAATIVSSPDVLIGVKVRLGKVHVGSHGIEALERAVQVAERAGSSVMVHITTTELPLERILGLLRKGDVITHAFHGRGERVVTGGRVHPAVWEARSAGIVFDIGHGSGGFSFETARIALADGFLPDTISTDLHALSIRGPVFDLPTTMSKMLALGMPLHDVIAASTVRAARAAGLDGEAGTLAVGRVADVAVLALRDGTWGFTDSLGQTIPATSRISTEVVVRAGEVVGHNPLVTVPTTEPSEARV